ncbi:MAG: type IV pilus twitching motility protein PilT [candidate division WOR-3 bacterium]|nr:MAG: type IV pilus twitching motility protein PilT [candidate division WOR-3 bacterium]
MALIQELLAKQIQSSASDLILKVGSPAVLRIHGDLINIDSGAMTDADIKSCIAGILTETQLRQFHEHKEIDISYENAQGTRFRVNVFRQQGVSGMVLRAIPSRVPTIEELGIPATLRSITMRPRGLIIVTGPSGCGKSTTQAALINHRNENDPCHIVTVEDPIEFIHKNKKALVTQREVGRDTHSFANALKFVLRQDPDVILVGEMRDLETISLAITAAETGHTVITTLHTSDSVSTIDRMIDVFPPHQQSQIRMQLSLNLLCVISQNLLKRTDGKGRVAAYEILIATPSVRNLIREAKTHQISSALQTSQQYGMISFDACLANFVRKRTVTKEEALSKALNPETFIKELDLLSKSSG